METLDEDAVGEKAGAGGEGDQELVGEFIGIQVSQTFMRRGKCRVVCAKLLL